MVIILRWPPHFPSHIVSYQTVIPTSDLYSFVSPAPHCCIVIQFQCFGGLCCVITNCLWQKFTRTSSSLWWITSGFFLSWPPIFENLKKKKQYLRHIYLVQIIKLQVTSARQLEFKLIMRRQHWETPARFNSLAAGVEHLIKAMWLHRITISSSPLLPVHFLEHHSH